MHTYILNMNLTKTGQVDHEQTQPLCRRYDDIWSPMLTYYYYYYYDTFRQISECGLLFAPSNLRSCSLRVSSPCLGIIIHA